MLVQYYNTYLNIYIIPNMALSWTGRVYRPRLFTGDEDLEMFRFYFENVAPRGKNEDGKSMELLVHIEGRAFRALFQRFTFYGKLTMQAGSFKVKNQALF